VAIANGCMPCVVQRRKEHLFERRLQPTAVSWLLNSRSKNHQAAVFVAMMLEVQEMSLIQTLFASSGTSCSEKNELL